MMPSILNSCWGALGCVYKPFLTHCSMCDAGIVPLLAHATAEQVNLQLRQF